MIVEIASGEVLQRAHDIKQKDPAAVASGRAGGLIGGKARAEKLTSTIRALQSQRVGLARGKKD